MEPPRPLHVLYHLRSNAGKRTDRSTPKEPSTQFYPYCSRVYLPPSSFYPHTLLLNLLFSHCSCSTTFQRSHLPAPRLRLSRHPRVPPLTDVLQSGGQPLGDPVCAPHTYQTTPSLLLSARIHSNHPRLDTHSARIYCTLRLNHLPFPSQLNSTSICRLAATLPHSTLQVPPTAGVLQSLARHFRICSDDRVATSGSRPAHSQLLLLLQRP